MNIYSIIDDIRGDRFESVFSAANDAEAIEEARSTWEALSEHDKRDRTEFSLVIGDATADDFGDYSPIWEAKAGFASSLKNYRVKIEFVDSWSDDADWDRIVSANEIARLANEWNIPFSDLMEQVEEI